MKPQVKPVEEDSRGILDPVTGLASFRLDRREPGPVAARFIDRYWIASWDLRGHPPHTQEVLAHPAVNVVFRPGAALVQGVTRARGAQVLEDVGCVLGVMFRPGGFGPFLGRPLTTITDRKLVFEEVFGSPGDRLARAVTGTLPDDLDAGVALVDRFFAGRSPRGRHAGEDVSRVVELVAADPTMVRVDDLARELGVGLRQLQRLFAEHVGVSPKWVIRRYRLYEAAEQAAKGSDVNWAGLAATLGYSDQAHLTRDFTKAIGVPPDRYARECASPTPPDRPNRDVPAGRLHV